MADAMRALLREYLENYPELQSAIRLSPPRLLLRKRWERITAARLCTGGLVVECGRLGEVRLPAPGGVQAGRREQLKRLIGVVRCALRPCRVVDLKCATNRNQHQTEAFARIVLQVSGGRCAVMAAFAGESSELSSRLASAAILWWDQASQTRHRPKRLALFVPWSWSRRIVSLLDWMSFPVSCYRYRLQPRQVERIFPRVAQTSALTSPYVIYPMSPTDPGLLAAVARQDREVDLVFRSRRWEISYLGLPVLWGDDWDGYFFNVRHPTTVDRDRLQPFWNYLAGVKLIRSFPSPQPSSPLYRLGAEKWLESRVMRSLSRVSPDFEPVVYCQVPTWLEADRKVLDLLTVTRTGRLVVIELKVEKEVNLLFQGVDYWDRVRQHLRRGDFERAGYFRGFRLTREDPLLYLISPAFEFHRVLPLLRHYIKADIRFECIGVNADWKRTLKIIRRFRL